MRTSKDVEFALQRSAVVRVVSDAETEAAVAAARAVARGLERLCLVLIIVRGSPISRLGPI